jgi:stress-induced morphogen
MDLAFEDIEDIIEDAIPDADAAVSRMRGEHDDDHVSATVVSPAFEGEGLVQQHEMVYDALDEHMTEEIHALDLSTYTPAEYEERSN